MRRPSQDFLFFLPLPEATFKCNNISEWQRIAIATKLIEETVELLRGEGEK